MPARLLAAGTFISLLAVRSALADSASGLVEYRHGRCAEAYRDWRQAAEAGDERSALFVGVRCDTGLGAPHEHARALYWYRRAADLGLI